jgi:serine/threonine protein kinase
MRRLACNAEKAWNCAQQIGLSSRCCKNACMNHTPLMSCRTDFQKTVQRILALDYKIPEKLQLSDAVKDLLAKIFVKDPSERIDIAGIKAHEWYLHRLPYELTENYQGMERYAAFNSTWTMPW